MKIAIIALILIQAFVCHAESNDSTREEVSDSKTNTLNTSTFSKDIHIANHEELTSVEKKLVSIGFKRCWFKSGNNFSAHSLVGTYKNTEFRVNVMIKKQDDHIITASLQATSSSSSEAKEACEHLYNQLKNKK